MDQRRTRGRPAVSYASPSTEEEGERYTEVDIGRLEAGELSDVGIIAQLREAYRQNDPEEEGICGGLRRDPTRSMHGTVEQLMQRVADAEEVLREKPKDYMSRCKRLYAMVGLEIAQQRQEHGPQAEQEVDLHS